VVTSLKRQNWQYLRKINQLDEYIAGIANTMKIVFKAYEEEFRGERP
jgi:hypothetical protein